MEYDLLAEGENGWSQWVSPVHGKGDRNYKLACCDCGLVHDMQFRAKITRSGGHSVIFRARRNKRATRKLQGQ